jgi:RNA polymerase sigma-70 factor (ECF subfamily)
VSAAVVRRRDADALRAFHDEHAYALWSYVLGLTNGDRGRAQDVVQETLLRAWQNRAVVEQVDGCGRGWLFAVAKRIVIDQWRWASRRAEVVTDRVPDQPVADTAQQTVDRQLVLTALRRLSTEHRHVLFECYLRGASVADAAETLGVPPGTIKSRTHYALHALRQAIEDLGGGPVTTPGFMITTRPSDRQLDSIGHRCTADEIACNRAAAVASETSSIHLRPK